MGKLRWIFLKVTELLKPIYRRLGFFPYPGSVTLQIQTKPWNDPNRVKSAATSIYERRHASINAALLIAATVILSFLVDIAPLESPSGLTIDTVWQIHATLIGLSFVVLVFLLEIVSRSRLVEGALAQLLRKSTILPILIYSLLGSLIIGLLSLYPALRADWISPNLPATIFVGTVLSVLFVYWKVVTLVLTDEIDEEPYTILKENISSKIQEDTTIYEYDQLLAEALPNGVQTEKPLYPYYVGRTDSLTADDLDLTGVVADIHAPTFAFGVSEIVRIGNEHQKSASEEDSNAKDSNDHGEDSGDQDEDEGEPVQVRVKIGDNLQDFSSILYIDSEFFHDEMESVYPILAASILTRTGSGRGDNVRTIYKYTDFIDQEGKRIVRNSKTRSFLRFLEQYEDVVLHSFHELDDARFLIEEHRYTDADLPFYDLDQILFRVFEESIEEMNREFANHVLGLVAKLIQKTTELELYGAYRRYMNLYSRFYFAITLRDDLISDNFATELIDTLIEQLRFSTRHGMEVDFDIFDDLDGFDIHIESYSEVALEEAHKMFKYAFENKDARGFTKIWNALSVPRNQGNYAVRQTVRREQRDMRFNAAAMTYDIAKEHEEYQDTFESIYNRCILKTYRNVPELFEIYFRINDKKGHRTRWGKWERQEHDLIQQMYGKPYSIEPEYSLGEFYCFTAIMNGHYDDHREDNPLQDESISEEDMTVIRTSVNDLKRNCPFIEFRGLVDEEEFKERADQFLEYHTEIVEDD